MTDTATLPLNAVQSAILEVVLTATQPLSAAEIYEWCDEAESIAKVHTALHVLHKRGHVERESVQPEKGKPYYVYRALADAGQAPIEAAPPLAAEGPEALETRPTKTYGPEFISALAAELADENEPAASVAADDDAGLAALADYLAADLAAEAKADDPVLAEIATLNERLAVPVWSDLDRRRMRAVAGTMGAYLSPTIGLWLKTVADRMESEAAL